MTCSSVWLYAAISIIALVLQLCCWLAYIKTLKHRTQQLQQPPQPRD